jgi:Tfp pilus assembly protein PilO
MSPKKFFYILLGATAVLVLCGAGGYYLALKYIRATSSTLSQALADSNAASDTLDSLAKLKSQYDHDIVPIIPLINEALPQTKNQTEILAQLQNIAGTTGLTLSTVTFPSPAGLPNNTSQTVPAGTVLALPVSFQLQGSYQQLQSFLTKVETLNRFTNVTTLAIQRPDKTKPITYSMTLNAYVKP